jgi:ribosomal protein L20
MDSQDKKDFDKLLDGYFRARKAKTRLVTAEYKAALSAFFDEARAEAGQYRKSVLDRLEAENKRLTSTTNALATQLHTAELNSQKSVNRAITHFFEHGNDEALKHEMVRLSMEWLARKCPKK